MTIAEMAARVRDYLDRQGCRIEVDEEPTSFAAIEPETGLHFVFLLPGAAEDDLGEDGLELQVILPLADWSDVRPEAVQQVTEMLACQDSVPGSSNSLGFVRDVDGKPARITLQGSTGLQTMGVLDEKDLRLLLESLTLDSADLMPRLRPYLVD